MMTYTIDEKCSNEYVTWIKVDEPNQKKETMVIEIHRNTNSGGANALPVLWKKHGFIDRVLETYVGVDTFVTDSEGNCYGRYNPQIKRSDDGKRNVINFDWMFEYTEENVQKLLNEVIRLFESSTGKSATEEKMEKVHKYAKENGLEVVIKKPDGWRELPGISSPCGSVVITNKLRFKEPNEQRALYVY